jgi:diamine N-acetyltransferase
LGAFWWEPVQGAQLVLRRPQAHDAAWLKACFADDDFASAVNRSYGERIRAASLERVAKELEHQLKTSPVDLGAQMFVIERKSGERLGLASFVMIDSDSRRAEFILGFPGQPPHGMLVFEAGFLLAEFAFRRAQFHKVTASFYGDNPRLKDLEHTVKGLSFLAEGVLRSHTRLPGGKYVDIRLWGALREDVLSNPAMHRYAKRFLGMDWSTQGSGVQHTHHTPG